MAKYESSDATYVGSESSARKSFLPLALGLVSLGGAATCAFLAMLGYYLVCQEGNIEDCGTRWGIEQFLLALVALAPAAASFLFAIATRYRIAVVFASVSIAADVVWVAMSTGTI